jgi:hypothetical protein
MIDNNAPVAKDQLLTTMNQDGSRRKIITRLSFGGFHRKRLWTAWFLIVVFKITP